MTPALAHFLQHSPFPPRGALPAVTDSDLAGLHVTAQGAPGDLVWPGLFPRPPAKLARLLLAARGSFDPASLSRLAETQYGGDRPRQERQARRYDAHDALACALVHPGLSATARAALATTVLSATNRRRGWRSRQKSWTIVRWAVQAGYVDRALLPAVLKSGLVLPPPGPPTVRPFPDPVLGPSGALDCYAAAWPRFGSHLARERATDAWIDYVGIAELGRRHFVAFSSGCRAPFVQAVFAATEYVLAHGDEAAQTLVVVGLFESVQGLAYHAGAVGDRYEAALGPHARRAWADLIEGWTGAGIRDLVAWRLKGEAEGEENAR